MSNDYDNVTDNVKYQLIDTQKLIELASFDSQEKAEDFLIDNPIYRKPGIKVIPTLTHRDMESLQYVMECLSDIYDDKNNIWFDNKVLNEIAKDFLEKLDEIMSSKSVKDYIQ